MTNLIKQYNALDGQNVTRKELSKLCDKLFNTIGESAEHEALFGEPHTKLSNLLNKFSDVNVFAITLSKKISENGLNGSWHTGIKKEALDNCNRLKKGYKYDKGGKIVKVSKTKAKPKTKKKTVKVVKREETPEALGIPFLSKQQAKEFGTDETVGLGKAFGNNDVYQMVTDRILDAIEGYGDLTWYSGRNSKKGKDHFVNVARPINYNLNKYYRGINAFLLSHYPTLKEIKVIKGRKTKLIELTPITDERLFWMTFKQIEAAKGKVKKGAISMEAVYYNFSYKLDGKNISEEKYKKLYKEFGCSPSKLDSDNCKRLEKNMFLRYYRVFNERDIENIDFEARRKKKADKAKKFVTVVEKIDAAEAVIKNMPNAPKIIEQHIGKSDSPHYDIMGDKVVMPLKMQYDDVSIWYGTAFHELVHSTGAEKRLSREGVTDFDRFGSPQYALEELIAELGSAYLNAESGIFLSTLKKNAAYIKGWKKAVVKLLQEDNKAIFKAAGQAQKAADYILDRDEKGTPKFYKDLDKKIKPKGGKPKKKSKKDDKQLALFAAAQKKKGLGFAVQPLQHKNYVLISQDKQQGAQHEFEKGFSNVVPSDAISKDKETPQQPERIENVAQAIKAVKKAINPEPKSTPKASSIVSTEDLMNMQFDTLDFTGKWSRFLENPARNMKIAIWGKPKNGKTVGACQLANYLTNFGKVLYNFADQGINASTQKIWKLTGLSNNDQADLSQARSLKELENICKTGEYSFIFIDMINTYIYRTGLKPHEFEDRFIKAFPEISFILIFEVTKSGNFKGDQAWTHLPDALVTVENYVMNASGRYGVGHHIIWPEQVKKTNPSLYDDLTEGEEPEQVQHPEPAPKGFVIESF